MLSLTNYTCHQPPHQKDLVQYSIDLASQNQTDGLPSFSGARSSRALHRSDQDQYSAARLPG